MCIIFLALDRHPQFALVLAANRDEGHDRSAAPCGWWDSNGPYAGVLAGRDLDKGGTWFGVNPRLGVWSCLTNVREPDASEPELGVRATTRGTLPLQCIAKPGATDSDVRADVRAAVERAHASAADYDGFNLLVGSGTELWWLTNRAPGQDRMEPHPQQPAGALERPGLGVGRAAVRLAPGVHAVSNAMLDTPWPKLARGKQLFAMALDADAARGAPPTTASTRRLVQQLFDQLLSDRQRPPRAELPSTGVAPEVEALLSSICVAQTDAERQLAPAGYGTVAQTVLLVGRDGRGMLAERQMRDGKPLGAPSIFEFEFGRPEARTLGLAPRFALKSRTARRVMLGLACATAACCLGLAVVALRAQSTAPPASSRSLVSSSASGANVEVTFSSGGAH